MKIKKMYWKTVTVAVNVVNIFPNLMKLVLLLLLMVQYSLHTTEQTDRQTYRRQTEALRLPQQITKCG